MGLEPLEALLASTLRHGQHYPFVPVSQPAVTIFCVCHVMKRSESITLSSSSMLPPPQSLFQTLQSEVSIAPSDTSPNPCGVSYDLLCIMGIFCFVIGISPASLPPRIGSPLRILFLFSYTRCLEFAWHVPGTLSLSVDLNLELT